MAEPVQIERIRKRELHSRVLELNERKRAYYLDPQLPLDRLSLKLEARTATKASVPVPDCITCGVCCSFALIVPVSHEDTSRLNRYCDILLDDAEDEIIVDRVLPRSNDGRCVHLTGELGKSIGCEIYLDRPRVCHEFDAGSDRCHEYRRMFAIEPQLPQDELRGALARVGVVQPIDVIEDVAIVSTGKVKRSSYNVADGTIEYIEADQLTIVAFLGDDTPHELHTFEYGREKWFESDLLGLSMEQAKEKIGEQAGW